MRPLRLIPNGNSKSLCLTGTDTLAIASAEPSSRLSGELDLFAAGDDAIVVELPLEDEVL